LTDESQSPKDLLAVPEEQITKELAIPAAIQEKFDAVMLEGDWSRLSKEERSLYIRLQCKRAGLRADLNPIMFIPAGGKLIPYLKKGAAEQLRAMHGLTAEVTEKQIEGGFAHVSVRISGPDGRFEDDIGSCPVGPDAFKKALTQAKRRATLAYCGMGAMDPRDEVEENGHSNGPTRISPPPVDPGSRFPQATPQPTQMPSVARPQASGGNGSPDPLPDPTKGGVTPPVAVPVVARPKR